MVLKSIENAIVVVGKPKPGKLRVCLDPKSLNEAIRRPRNVYTFRYCILDSTHACWSLILPTIAIWNQVIWRYCFIRKVNEIFEGLSGIKALVDDILIFGRISQQIAWPRDRFKQKLVRLLSHARWTANRVRFQ